MQSTKLLQLQPSDIIAVKGTGFISKLIQFITHSEYSHIAIVYKIDKKIWIGEINYSYPYKIIPLDYKDDMFDVYACKIPIDIHKMQHIIENLIGSQYDFRDIIRLLFKIQHIPSTYNLICSEAVNEIYKFCGVELSDKAVPSPKDIVMSDKLFKKEIIK